MKKLPAPIRYPRITGRILDVGSGNNCLDLATHLVDLHPDDAAERGGALERPDGREFKEGSLEALPYPDKYFDLIHASHVLEHVDHPARALAELQRTGHSGYIETPAPVMEQCATRDGATEPGLPFHKWYVWTFPDQKTLYIKPKTTHSLHTFCTCSSGQTFQNLDKRNVNLARIEPLLPYFAKMTQFVWHGTIDHEIWGEDQQGQVGKEGGCNCYYTAFLAHFRKVLRSITQIKRRIRFQRELPDVFSLLKETALGR